MNQKREGCSLVVNPLWSGASTERTKTSRWMPRVPPPTRPPGAPRLGGVYTGTEAGDSVFLLWSFRVSAAGWFVLESWPEPSTEIPKRDAMTRVLGKIAAIYFIAFPPC